MLDFKPNRHYTAIAVYALIVIAFTALCVSVGVYWGEIWNFVRKLLEVIQPLIYGVVFAYLLSPFVAFNERMLRPLTDSPKERPKLRRSLAITVAAVSTVAVLALFVAIVLPQITSSYFEFSAMGDSYLAKAEIWLEGFLGENPILMRLFGGSEYTAPEGMFEYGGEVPNLIFSNIHSAQASEVFTVMRSLTVEAPAALASEIIETVLGTIGRIIGDVAPGIIDFVVDSIGEVMDIIIGFIVMIYVLFAKERLIGCCRRIGRVLLPTRSADVISEALKFANKISRQYFIGRFLSSMLLGLICSCILLLLSVPYAPLLSLMCAVMNIVPYVGVFIAAIAGCVILLLASPEKIIIFLLVLIALSQLEARYIEPQLLGTRIFLTPEWVIIAVIVCWGIFGLLGMFIAVPLFTFIYYLLEKFIKKRKTENAKKEDTAAADPGQNG